MRQPHRSVKLKFPTAATEGASMGVGTGRASGGIE